MLFVVVNVPEEAEAEELLPYKELFTTVVPEHLVFMFSVAANLVIDSSIAKVRNSMAKVTNSMAKVRNSVAKVTNSIAKTCNVYFACFLTCFSMCVTVYVIGFGYLIVG